MNTARKQQRAFKKMMIYGVKAFSAFQEWRGVSSNGSLLDLGSYLEKALASNLCGKQSRKIEISTDTRKVSSSPSETKEA